MADLTIANAATLTGAGTASGDLFPLLDVSASAGSQGSKITRDELRISMGITGGGTLATAGYTLTLPATGTAALLGTANVFTAAQTISVAGANSTSALYLTGALNVAGTGTTTFPHIFHQPTGATAATTWSSGANAGTVFGANEAPGFVGNFLDLRVAGVISSVISYDGRIKGIYNPGYPQFTAAGLETSGMRVCSDRVDFWQAGIVPLTFQGNDINLGTATTINWTSGATLRSKAAATLQLGNNSTNVTNQMFTAASRIISDGVGANLTIAGGNGRGGAGGSLIFSTYSTEGAATIGTLTTRLTLDTTGLLTFADAVDMAFNTTTGTKIGTAATQKIGFWNATPVVQPTGADQAAISDGSGGTNTGALVDAGITYTQSNINDNFTNLWTLQNAMRNALVNSGLMKGSV